MYRDSCGIVVFSLEVWYVTTIAVSSSVVAVTLLLCLLPHSTLHLCRVSALSNTQMQHGTATLTHATTRMTIAYLCLLYCCTLRYDPHAPRPARFELLHDAPFDPQLHLILGRSFHYTTTHRLLVAHIHTGHAMHGQLT